MLDHAREFDAIIWGATGFTGRLVAEYLVDRYGAQGELRWAIGGRNRARLEEVRAGLGPGAETLPLVLGDSHDLASLEQLARSTKVVCTTVGPYARYGNALIEACVKTGTDYCDLTGESHWIRHNLDTHLAAAQASGARIVHCCGFDSVPFDIGVLAMQAAAIEHSGEPASHIKTRVKAVRGGASGGTVDSIMNMIDQVKADPKLRKIIGHPYCLNPEGERQGPDGADQAMVLYDEDALAFTAPFIMAAINTRVVRRSNALMGYPWGKDFRYDEAVITAPGAGGWLKATGTTLGLGAAMAAGSFSLGRKALFAMGVPRPGEGPSKAERESGFYKLLSIAKLRDGRILRGVIRGDRDPGYGSTSKILGESAVCLARDEVAVGGGIWTPASALGHALRDRLEVNAGVTFSLEEPISDG